MAKQKPLVANLEQTKASQVRGRGANAARIKQMNQRAIRLDSAKHIIGGVCMAKQNSFSAKRYALLCEMLKGLLGLIQMAMGEK